MESRTICRTCLRDKNKCVPIFSAPELWGKNIVIAKLIMACAPVVIKIGDGLPSTICDQCLELLQISFLFRLRVITANENFKEIAQTKVAQDGQLLSKNQTANLNHIYSTEYIVESIANDNFKVVELLKQETLDIKEEHIDIIETSPVVSSELPSTTVTNNPQIETESTTLSAVSEQQTQTNVESAKTSQNSKTKSRINTIHAKKPEISEAHGKCPVPLNLPQNHEKKATSETSQTYKNNTKSPENPQNSNKKHAIKPGTTKIRETPAKTSEYSPATSAKIPERSQNQKFDNNSEIILPEQYINPTVTLSENKQTSELNKRGISRRLEEPTQPIVKKKRTTNNSNKPNDIITMTDKNNTSNAGDKSTVPNKEKDAEKSAPDDDLNFSLIKKFRISRTYSKVSPKSTQLSKLPEVLLTLPKDYNLMSNNIQQNTEDLKLPTVRNLRINSNECIVIDDD